MLLSVRSFRRRTRVVLAMLTVMLYLAIHHHGALQTVTLCSTSDTEKWSRAAHDEMRKRLKEATKATDWWWQQGTVGHDELLLNVSNSTLGFQEIFVVNLPSRTDRRDSMALATSLTDLRVTFSDGIDSNAIQDRILPADSRGRPIAPGNKGSWRAHMDVLRRIIERNLTTALVMEDDIDWDIRLKAQMMSFALAARVFNQPLTGSNRSEAQWHTPVRKDVVEPGERMATHKQRPMPGKRRAQQKTTTEHAEEHTHEENNLPLAQAPRYQQPLASPYGDDWDVLWLGHCGTDLPSSPPILSRQQPDTAAAGALPAQLSLLRVTIANDTTVPGPASLKPHPFALPDKVAQLYPPHTRVVHAASGTLCTQAYAVSQRGARKLLYQFGLASFTTGWDLMLRDWCDGLYRQGPGTKPRWAAAQEKRGSIHGRGAEDGSDGSEGNRHRHRGNEELLEPVPQCLTVQPPLFSHYLTANEANSDIQAQGGGYLHKAGSQYIRLSVQSNLRRLVNGAGWDQLWDQWPGVDEAGEPMRR